MLETNDAIVTKEGKDTSDTIKKEDTKEGPASPMGKAFEMIERDMYKKFQDRVNSPEEDKQLTSLVLGERFTEMFEILRIGNHALGITFRNTNEEEDSFCSGVSVTNRRAISLDPNVNPDTDETRRFETLLALATVSINSTDFDNLDLKHIRDRIAKGRDDEAFDTNKVSTNFMSSLDDRVIEIKRRLPRGAYPIALRAFRVWLRYQESLVTGVKLENFYGALSVTT